MIPPPPTTLRRPVRQQRLDPRPLRVSQQHTSTNDQMIRKKRPKPDLGEEQVEACLDLLRQVGETCPAVKSYVVGPHPTEGFAYGAAFVIEDLDGYHEYLNHPAHVRLELEGIGLLARFEAFDITDSADPEIKAKIEQVQARHFAEHPEIAALVAQAASFTRPGGEGTAAPSS
ncbi:Dabb family protein [Streptomyces sp. NPDC127051]|uniref:Dabb family protein n=1 Tax=Streptomyces sp. NPDC127051 TaxID=3347119 RepID=UPI003668DF5D